MLFAEEWPLMMFTLLSQFAVGTLTILFVLRLLVKDQVAKAKFTLPAIKIVVPVMAVALVLSLFHLGTPSGAYRSIFNLGSSWLSREILTAGGFFVLAAVCWAVYKNPAKGNALGLITALVGLAAVFCMASIYYNSVMPAWMSINTYVVFFGSTFVLGSLGALAVLALKFKGSEFSPEIKSAIKKVLVISIVALAVPLVYTPVFISGLSGGEAAARLSAQLFTGSYLAQLILRWLLSAAGVALLYVALAKKDKPLAATNAVLLSLALVIVGEFLGRYVFYATAVPPVIG